MKRLIHQLPLIAGCLFLAWALLLITKEVTGYYEAQNVVSVLEDHLSASELSSSGFCYIVNAFLFLYNRSGYYDHVIPYLEVNSVTERNLAVSFVVIYLLLALILTILAAVSKSAVPCYIVSGVFLGILLLIGYLPEYGHLVILVITWMYLNLAQNFMRLKDGKTIKEFLREFPLKLLPVYLILLLLILLLPSFMPSDILPETDNEVKDSIFARLQEIQLVSDQYDENRRRQQEELQSIEETEVGESEEDWLGESSAPYTEEQENGGDRENQDLTDLTEEGNTEFSVNQNGSAANRNNENESRAGQNNQNLGGLPGIFASDDAGESKIGFSLSSGGGVSGGRTDRAGNLSFNGETVLTAYANFEPTESLYIRLFYAEGYEDNRWKQTEEEHFGRGAFSQARVSQGSVLELSMPAFYGLYRENGKEYSYDDTLYIKYPEDTSENMALDFSLIKSTEYPETDSYLMDRCREVPEDIRELFHSKYPDFFQSDLTDMMPEQAITQIDQLLEETAYYTLSPGKAPEDKDFITWFLTESGRGYCMHFASAGVMMLREAGISARYAEGYFIPSSAWEKQENGRWCAQIQDSNAHAWAEVYLQNEFYEAYWRPVELTPAYNGELAGSFAGQQDVYVGRAVIPGAIVKGLKIIFCVICVVLLAAAGSIIYKKGKVWYEYRMLHTGSRRQDVKNMTKLLLKKLDRKNRKVRSVLKKDNLTQEEFKKLIPGLVSEFGQDKEAEGWFKKFSDYAYKAAFGAYISKQERNEALDLYKKLRHKLEPQRIGKKRNDEIGGIGGRSSNGTKYK